MPVDLHVHTTASDGELSPSEVVRIVLVAELTAVAITDHDSTDGLDEAIAAADRTTLSIVSGVELSVDEPSGKDVHVLGLLVDHRDAGLTAALRTLRADRMERARAITSMLSQAGIPVDLGAVAALAGAGSIGRVHIARALVDSGSARTVEEAFRLYIGRGAPFYVRKHTLDAAHAVDAIHAAGGVAVLAHPGVSGESALPVLIAAGLDGIEAFHAEHTAADRTRFADLARRHGLLVTGGSDFHGPGLKSAPLGGGECPDEAVESLRERAALYCRRGPRG
jgi:predicted metal-dependent phosphoesterase TrpH